MDFRRRIALGLAAIGLVAGSACSREGSGGGQEVGTGASSLISLTRVGFYAFDGTGMDYSKTDGVIRAMYDRARVRTKAYFAGPDLPGTLTRSIIERGKARICNDWRTGRIDSVALAGYSRGAVIAMAIAYELHLTPAGGAPGGCSNVDARLAGSVNGVAVVPSSTLSDLFRYIGRSDRPVIGSLALLDAVNTLNTDIGGDTVSKFFDVHDKIPCVHYVKRESNEGFAGILNTLDVEGCGIEKGAQGVGHRGLAKDRDALAALEKVSTRGDLQFVDAPAVESLARADYTALCPLVRATAVGAGNGYERCTKALCSWDGRPAGEGTCRAPERVTVQFPSVADTATRGTGSFGSRPAPSAASAESR